jgi:2'-5' RNA ligase
MASNPPTRRLFFALWPDETTRAAFVHATHKAVRSSGGRPMPEHNLHVTLVFLGSVAESRIPDLRAIASRAAVASVQAHPDEVSPPQLIFDRIEFWKKAGVLVATTSAKSQTGQGPVDALVGVLQRETVAAGFTPDLKPYRPHITLARKVAHGNHDRTLRPVLWSLTEFALVESRTDPEGAVYSVLELFPWGLRTRS